jgi:hypothetical protein
MTSPATIRFVTRPGLAKARALPLVRTQRVLAVRTADPPWRDLFERADVVSEGGVRDEAGGRTWYGSTSLVLSAERDRADGGPDPALLAGLAARNAHVRLRAVRVAYREASLRAPGRLGRFVCEIHITHVAGGVRIDVDVQAPLIERRAEERRAR